MNENHNVRERVILQLCDNVRVWVASGDLVKLSHAANVMMEVRELRDTGVKNLERATKAS